MQATEEKLTRDTISKDLQLHLRKFLKSVAEIFI